MTQPRGFFITLEGGEGAGKSTQAKRLAAALQAAGHETILTREPGGTPGAEAIRAVLLDPATVLAPLADTLLHFAARADHVAAIIKPAIARGAIVICDRFYDSTMAYQGYGMGVDIAAIAALIRLIGLIPDVSLFLELPDSEAKVRLLARGLAADRYDLMGEDIRARIAHGFHTIAAADPERCVIVDASPGPDEVAAAILHTVQSRLAQ